MRSPFQLFPIGERNLINEPLLIPASGLEFVHRLKRNACRNEDEWELWGFLTAAFAIARLRQMLAS
ncbi:MULTISPECIES: hypothetical protein [Trichocoleus]|uniref:Transposase n=1 Tax=Trichocoleus desertorum GB2-A4 TaxID=2933944 RepID=A0ABV0JCQ2_9CYAN|nr:hypothetical protein [Trichocoleus sp. FACHB-46]MBD1864215.1 hypothetical protein [Trichocoleus sp. FACHB-46]